MRHAQQEQRNAYELHGEMLRTLAEGVRVFQDALLAIRMQKAHEGYQAHVAQRDEDGLQELARKT